MSLTDRDAKELLEVLRCSGTGPYWRNKCVFRDEWRPGRLMPLLVPHANRFAFKLVGVRFPEGVAYTLRTADAFEIPLLSTVLDSEEAARRQMADLVRCYIAWLRKSADELGRRNAELLAQYPAHLSAPHE